MTTINIEEIKEAADLVLKTCRQITELEKQIKNLNLANGLRVGITISGLSSEHYDRGQAYLDLGDSHKVWVIQRLHQMVEEHKDALLKIRPFYAQDSCEASADE